MGTLFFLKMEQRKGLLYYKERYGQVEKLMMIFGNLRFSEMLLLYFYFTEEFVS